MNWMEVSLLGIGIGAFILSFLLPGKKGKDQMSIDMDAFNALMDKEMKDAKIKVEEIVDETLEYAVEKAQRASERISNEKIMAINEYSDTVLADVNKAHQEVMFLYDMLNDKHKNIKETVKEVETKTKQVQAKVNEAVKATEEKKLQKNVEDNKKTEAATINVQTRKHVDNSFAEGMPTLMPSLNDKSNKIEVFSFATQAPKYERISNQEKNNQEFKPLEQKVEVVQVPSQATKMEESVSNIHNYEEEKPIVNEEENNNDKILRLSRAGMSTVEIAKELGLGVGEVKLVLNLFKGAV